MAHSGAATRRQTRADAGLLKRLVPPASIGWDDFHALALGTALEQLPAGTVVFREGDADPDVVYLVSGAIEVGSSSGTAQLVEAGSDLARQPLAEAEPRQAGARAATAVTLLRIDRAKARSVAEARALIDVDELSLDEADPLPSCDAYRADWMSTLLRSPILGRLEPTAVQRLLSCLHEVGVRAGEVVVRQGEPADGLCIVVSGTCTMTRTTHGGAALVLDRLEEGASFGAEAILLDAPQPATVTMDTDGRLLRLDAERFRTLLAAPLLTECDGAAATHLLRLGAIPLDVRQSTAGGGPALADAIRLPWYMVRLRAASLDRGRPYLCFCDDGRESATAAFLLGERGFDATVMTPSIPGGDEAPVLPRVLRLRPVVGVTPTAGETDRTDSSELHGFGDQARRRLDRVDSLEFFLDDDH